ncbi:MAG: hypothetical protein RSE07_06815, partial [Oscillospiraceae bacterium]
MGNESQIPAVIYFNNGDVEYDNVLFDSFNDYSEGVIKNGYLFDNIIYANETDIFYKQDSQKFYNDDNSLFYSKLSYYPLEYEFYVYYDGKIENSFLKLNYQAEGNYKIYYRRESKLAFYPSENNNFYKKENELFYPQDENWYLMPDKLL